MQMDYRKSIVKIDWRWQTGKPGNILDSQPDFPSEQTSVDEKDTGWNKINIIRFGLL